MTISDAGQIALHRELPVLRVADAEVGSTAKVFGVIAGGGDEPVGQRQRIRRRCSARSRLFESGDCCASSVAID